MEEPFTGFEVIHPTTNATHIILAELMGKNPAGIDAFVGAISEQLPASAKEEEAKRNLTIPSTKVSEPLVTLHPYPLLSPRSVMINDWDDDLSIVSSVTNHVESIASVYSNECSIITEMHQVPANSVGNRLSVADDPSKDSDYFPTRKRNHFTCKVFKKFSISEVDTGKNDWLKSTHVAVSSAQKKNIAKQRRKVLSPRSLLTKLSSILRKNIHELENMKIISKSDENITCDASTAVLSQDSSKVSSRSVSTQSSKDSSITVSTADFDENPSNLNELAFGSYLKTTPWDAAAKGDYATLHYIANHENYSHENVWTRKDASGHVPLYYACVSGGYHGKYGLESVKLLLDVWPGGSVPSDFIKFCLKETQNRAVKKELKKRMGRYHGFHITKRQKSTTVLEGTEHVTPQSFLDDLGDDGYVEDY